MRKITTIALLLSLVWIVLFSVPAQGYTPEFAVQSKAVYLINTDTGNVVFSQRENEKMYPASITKVMTAIVVLEEYGDRLDEMVTAQQNVFDELFGTDSSTMGVKLGETLSARDLLFGMVIHSANEAACILADHFSDGDRALFIKKMNEKAAALGMTSSHFTNPHGLHEENQYVTAKDVYLMSAHAMTLPLFADMVAMTRYSLPATNKRGAQTLINTNKMMEPYSQYYMKGVKGIKTGTTDEAGFCLTSIATQNGYTYMCVAMGAPCYDDNKKPAALNGAFVDSKKLYEWAFSGFYKETVISVKEPMGQIKVNLSKDTDSLQLNFSQDFVALIPKAATDPKSAIKVEPHVPDSIDAPVQKGQKIGTATLMLAGEVIGEVDLLAAESVERSGLMVFLQGASNVIDSLWFKLIVALLILLIAAYVVYAVIHNNRRKKLKKVKRYRHF